MANKFVCVDIHTVRQKETLYSIAKKYGVNIDLLMRVNDIRNPYQLKPGTRLCIPGMIVPDDHDESQRPDRPVRPGQPARPSQPGQPVRPGRPISPVSPGSGTDGSDSFDGSNAPNSEDEGVIPDDHYRTHIVRKGDTLYMIAKMYNITLDALMSANPDIDPYRLQIGMELRIPVRG